jgi:hypothetical protein
MRRVHEEKHISFTGSVVAKLFVYCLPELLAALLFLQFWLRTLSAHEPNPTMHQRRASREIDGIIYFYLCLQQ